jgi:hypothetical protein
MHIVFSLFLIIGASVYKSQSQDAPWLLCLSNSDPEDLPITIWNEGIKYINNPGHKTGDVAN